MQQHFSVTGMICGHCEAAITRAILKLDPEARIRIDRSQNRVDVDSDIAREQLAETIRDEGYTVAA